MPAYDVSYWPEYKAMVTGMHFAHIAPNKFRPGPDNNTLIMPAGGTESDIYNNFYRRRGLRAMSALPDVGSIRASSALPDPVYRSLSVARDIISEPPPPSSSFEYPQYWDNKDAIERSRRVIDRIDNYWLTRQENAVRYPEATTYVSPAGRTYKILAPARKRFPTPYWASYPYSSNITPFYSYGRRNWSYFDPLYDNYVQTEIGAPYERSSYYRSPYVTLPKRDWRVDYPYESLIYRPSYSRYSRLRDSYLQLPQPAYYRRVYY